MVVDDANDHVMSVWDLSKSHPKKITETKVSDPARNTHSQRPPGSRIVPDRTLTPGGPLGLELSHSEPTPNASLLIDYSLAEPESLIARTTQDFPLIVNFPQLSLEFSPLAMLTDSLLSLSTILSSEFC